MTPTMKILGAITRLSQCKNANVSDAVLKTYTEMLSPYDADAVVKACGELALEPTFGFPQLGVIVERIKRETEGPVEIRAKEAWRAVLRACSSGGIYRDAVFLDPAMGEAVRIAVGSWPAMCSLDTESYAYGRAEKTFLAVYADYARTPKLGEPVILRGMGSMPAKTYTVKRIDGIDGAKQISDGKQTEPMRELSPAEATKALSSIMARVGR